MLLGSSSNASGAKRHLQAVLHASGVLADAALANHSLSSLRAVYAPKAEPVARWRPLLTRQPAALELLFSSIASLLGAPGQAGYSAANALLDCAAAAAQQQGVRSLSVQWGAWAGGGMASQETAARVERMGMGMIGAEQGLAALQGILSGAMAAVTAANPLVWARFLARLRPHQKTQMFGAFVSEAPAQAASAPTQALSAAAEGAASAALSLSAEAVASQVAAAVAAVLGAPVAANASLMEAGLDSLGAGERRVGHAWCTGPA